MSVQFRIPHGSNAAMYGMASKAGQTIVQVTKQDQYNTQPRMMGQMVHTRNGYTQGEWMTSGNDQIVQLGYVDGGTTVTVSMTVQDGANLRSYPLRIADLKPGSAKIGAQNPYDGIGMSEMIVISWNA